MANEYPKLNRCSLTKVVIIQGAKLKKKKKSLTTLMLNFHCAKISFKVICFLTSHLIVD